MLRIIRVIALLASAAALPAQALTFLTEENPPFNYTEGGKPTGLSTDIVTEMAKRAGVPVTVAAGAWDAAFKRAQAEKDVCLFSTARLENRERLFRWVGPIATNRWVIVGPADFPKPIADLADLRRYRIGAVRTDAKVEYLKSNAVTDIREAAEDRENPPKLLLGKQDPNHIDLWVTGVYAARKLAAEANVKGLKELYTLRDEPLYLACSPRTAEATTRRLSDALAAMKKDGTVARIVESYDKRFAP